MTAKFKVGDWVCEDPYDPEYDEIYQIKDVSWSHKSGEWCYSLEGHELNGASDFNETKDWYFGDVALRPAPDYAIKELLTERTTHQILTRLSGLDILKLVPDDLTPDQISQIMPVVREISILSGLAAGVLRGK